MECSVDYHLIKKVAGELASRIESREGILVSAMLKYEPYAAIKDQIERSCFALRNIDSEFDFFDFYLSKYSAFLPLNLPLYSIVLFGVVPSFFSKQVLLRAPQVARDVVDDIEKIIDLKSIGVDNVTISKDGREEYIRKIYDSDAVCFTGTYKNSIHVRKSLNPKCIFLFNGAGINPVVVDKHAYMDFAVSKCIEVKAFNSGQDCAGPDAFLVEESVVDVFISKLSSEIASLKVDDSFASHPTVCIGPLLGESGAMKMAKFFDLHKRNIVLGGQVDLMKSIVYPTVLRSSVSDYANYTELFSPVWYVHSYNSHSDLKDYFSHDTYVNHSMYVSTFGFNGNKDVFGNTTILEEKIILDVESGNNEYGGSGVMASSITYDRKTIPKAILLSRDISLAINSREELKAINKPAVEFDDLLV